MPRVSSKSLSLKLGMERFVWTSYVLGQRVSVASAWRSVSVLLSPEKIQMIPKLLMILFRPETNNHVTQINACSTCAPIGASWDSINVTLASLSAPDISVGPECWDAILSSAVNFPQMIFTIYVFTIKSFTAGVRTNLNQNYSLQASHSC